MAMSAFGWVTRYSQRGIPYQALQSTMPWIDPEVLDSTVYLYPSEAEAAAGERIGGSGFLIGVPLPREKLPPANILCVVTNKHVIHSGNMTVRVNTVDGGKDIIPLDHMKWFTHPDGDDVAVCPIRLMGAFHKVKFISTGHFLSKKTIDDLEIGPGDDVFIVGRFVNHEGKQRNTPSVRFGCISQMPSEPIVIDGFPQESFLVEARSISGYSGSPVFVYLPQQVDMGINPEIKKMVREGKISLPGVSRKRVDFPMQLGPMLLGIDYCHIRWDEPIWSRVTKKPVNDDWYIKSNTGMMGVVPAWRLLELLEGAEMKPIFDEAKRAALQMKVSVVELDVADLSKETHHATGENPQHREDFTSLLRAAAQKPKQGD